jgi:hypothetical protein
MAKKNLATATAVNTMQLGNSIIIEVGGSVRRITLANLIDAINSGDTQLLHSVAWGVPLKQNLSSPAWGRVGNLNLWEEYKAKSGRYLVKQNGTAAKLSTENSGIYADGTPLDETDGNIMVVFPDLYYRVVSDPVTNVNYLWMSMIPIGGHVIKHPVIGAYKGTTTLTELVSRSGAAPAGSKTISQFLQLAKMNGSNWGLTNYDHIRFMMMLALSEYGSPNIQAQLGYGLCGSTSNGVGWTETQSLQTGATKSLGDAAGKIDVSVSGGTNCSHVSLFGIEDPYGWQWEMIQGIYCGSSSNSGQTGSEVFVYEGNRMPSAAELASHPSGEYRELNRLTSSGYIKTELLGEYFDLFPASLDGGSTSYWCDYSYASTTGQLVLWGGVADSGAACGLAYVHSYNAFSGSNAYFGARLAYYGELTIVNGADIA